MYFHKEGHSLILATVAITSVFIASSFLVEIPMSIFYPILGLCLFFLIIFLQFFRNPKPTIVINSNQIIAPADGKVVVIETTVENEYFNDERIQVSIFMSPFNVHVNRIPITGSVNKIHYKSGEYLNASLDKASEQN